VLTRQQLPHYQFTKAGYEALQKEQAELLAKRPEAVEDLRKAREMGDLSENGYYKAARAKLSEIDSRLRHLKHLLHFGKIIEPQSGDRVTFGSKVTINDGRQDRTFTIVGKEESDPMQGKLSEASPIGKALMGKKAGDTVEVDIPAGKVTYKIVKIS
jgi:transcription elongation factor GreA